jgi:three-Cys-motif partner protein
MPDPFDDGLPVSDAGEWALEKHDRLRRYIDIARGVRKKFISKAGATYIDLYSGPGRSRIQKTEQLIDGSPLVAAAKAKEGGASFNEIFIADANAEFLNAAHIRLEKNGFAAHKFVGNAEDTVAQIAGKLNPYGLHFAFLDPYNLDDLPFSIIEKLASLKHMDMLIHVSVQDLNRNLRRYLKNEGGPLDRVAPGWRNAIDVREIDRNVRQGFLNHWLDLIRNLDMLPSQGIERVSGGNNQPLYWLVLVSRHKRAGEFWDKIRNVTPQGRLDL